MNGLVNFFHFFKVYYFSKVLAAVRKKIERNWAFLGGLNRFLDVGTVAGIEVDSY